MKNKKWLSFAGGVLLAGLSLSACNMNVRSDSAEKNWTVMVYMCADNNLDAAALNDINEMEAAKFDDENVNILVLADIKNEGTKLYQIRKDENGMNDTIISKSIASKKLGIVRGSDVNLNVAKSETLSNFISFCRKNFPAKHDALVIWGHGSGWRNVPYNDAEKKSRAVAFDDESRQFMPLPSLAQAIEMQCSEKKLDLIGMDTCFGLELEVLYELKDCAQWFAGVEGFEDADGWQYAKWFSSFDFASENDGSQMGLALEKQFIEKNDTNFGLIDLSKMEGLFEKFESFCENAAGVIKDAGSRKRVLETIRNKVINFYVAGADSDVVVDVLGFAKLLVSEDPSLSVLSAQLVSSVKEAVVTGRSYVVDRYPLGIYLCAVNSENEFQSDFSKLYINGADVEGQTKFVKESKWYVPSVERRGSVLDRLFGMTYFGEEE